MFENVQNIRQSYKLHLGSHEKLESGINSGRKNVSRGEHLERHLPLFLIAMIPHLHTQEMHLRLQIRKITRKYQLPYVHG